MKILITGANGYIGKALVNSFKTAYEVIGVTRQDFDLTNRNAVSEYFKGKYFDLVIHCAIFGGGRLKKDTSIVLDNNLLMYYNLIENRSNYGKFISFGSGAELYNKEDYYGMSKHVIRTSMQDRQNFYNIRIFGLFDEFELNSRFIKANLLRYIKKEDIEIYENKIMDIFYMKDFITLLHYYITNNNPPKEIDCTYKKSYELIEIANMINNLDSHKVKINVYENKSNYSGKFIDLGLDYIGLQKGILETYNKIKTI